MRALRLDDDDDDVSWLSTWLAKALNRVKLKSKTTQTKNRRGLERGKKGKKLNCH